MSGQQVRSRAAEPAQLAARHGITALASASAGHPRGHVVDDRDLLHVSESQQAAADLSGAEVTLYFDGALGRQHVRPRSRHRHVPVSDVRPDPHALLQLRALPGTTEVLRDDGDAARSDRESATAGSCTSCGSPPATSARRLYRRPGHRARRSAHCSHAEMRALS